jgi:hypothetical protein
MSQVHTLQLTSPACAGSAEKCHMYGPAVRGKMEFREGERESCINVFGL